jgi:ankyrin repeat protein
MELLLERGANVEAHGKEQLPPLHSAAANGHVEMVRLLLAKGANVDSQAGRYSPLAVAARNGSVEVVRFLLNMGANAHLESEMEYSPLEIAREILENSGPELAKRIEEVIDILEHQ